MCAGNVLHLKTCRRSGGNLFSFYTSLYPGGALAHLSLQDQVAQARRLYPRKRKPCRFNLVVSHAKRQRVNKSCFDHFSFGKELLECELSEELVGAVFEGCALMGNLTSKGLTHGAFMEVENWSEQKVRLKDIETGEQLEIPISQLKTCRLGYACTYCSAQGRNMKDVCLWDTSHPRFTTRHLSMGLGRGVSDKQVSIA